MQTMLPFVRISVGRAREALAFSLARMNSTRKGQLTNLDCKNVTGRSFSTTTAETTVDPKELNKFRALSERWWSGKEFLPLRQMNRLRVPFIVESFGAMKTNNQNSSLPLEGIRLLDIGCGGGLLSEALSRVGATVTGIDPVQESIDAAFEHANLAFSHEPDRIPDYQCTTIEQFVNDCGETSSYDGIIASEVLEHVDNLELFLRSALNCLRPGGNFLITTINQTPFSYLGAILIAENVLGLAPKNTHQYEKFVPPSSLSLVLNDFGCDVIKVHGMLLNPVSLQWSWTQNQSINYAMLAVKRDIPITTNISTNTNIPTSSSST